MSELSVFIDESGDAMDGRSRYYLVGVVLHNQDMDFAAPNAKYVSELARHGLADIPFHMSPLMNGHEDFEGMPLGERKRRMLHFGIFAEHFPFHYHVFRYEKRHFADESSLGGRMQRDITAFLRGNLGLLQSFDKVKVYYDGGQRIVAHAVREAVRSALAKEAIAYRDASPKAFRLLQLADYVCGLELTALKYERGEQTRTDRIFFGDKGNFKRNWLRKARRHLLA